MMRKILEVWASGPGEVVSWRAFRKGLFRPVGSLARWTLLTTMLTDAVTNMWKVCQETDPSCQRVVRKANGFFSNYFLVDFIGSNFIVEAERRMASGLNPERSSNYLVTFTTTANDQAVLASLVDRYKQLGPDPTRETGPVQMA
jgi:DNA/RNA-binding domain of Phe-tRNA-synthetase-like protein